MKKQLLLMGSLLLSSAVTFGAGYQLNLQGLRQLAMGGSGTAIPWDAATIFYNPGGLTEFRHLTLYASGQFIMPNVQYVPTPTGNFDARTKDKTYPTFNIYAGGPIVDKSKLSIGIGVYTPFGSGTKWDDNWTGRYIIQEIKLQSIFFQPTVSYKFNDIVSVGAGFIYAVGSVHLDKAIPLQNVAGADGHAQLKGDGHGVGFNIGVHVMPTEKMHLGLTYRSQVNMKVKRGYASFDVPSSVASSFPYTAFSATLPLPQVLSLGVGFNVSEKVTLQADINFVGWKAYDTLSFDYQDNTAALEDTHTPRRYKNTLAVRAGMHYKFSDKVQGMIGAAWDPSPVRDGFVSPDLPDANRGVFTAGLSYKPAPKLSIMAAVEYVRTIARKSSFDAEGFQGKYQTTAFTPGIGLAYNF